MSTVRSSRIQRVLLVAVNLLVTVLACARADLPPQELVNRPSPTVTSDPSPSPSDTPTSLPTPTSTAAPMIPPTETPTPARPQPLVSPTFPPTATLANAQPPETILYEVQAGDTLHALAVRFAVLPEDITSPGGSLPLPGTLLAPGQLLLIPRRLGITGPAEWLVPDSEIVFSPHAADFDVSAFAAGQGGYLNDYSEYVGGARRKGPEVLALAARDNSTNPRILLTVLEYVTHWVSDPSHPSDDVARYPLGHVDYRYAGLYRQLTWLSNELGKGYYGWRAGMLTDVTLADGMTVRLEPGLNAGTVALQYFFSLNSSSSEWAELLGPAGFMATYASLFGDPWSYEHPLLEPGVKQPEMILPFLPGRKWYFTGGPHGAWMGEAAWAALDFAPDLTPGGCTPAYDWTVAAAPGLVVRSENGVVALDLDGDGREQTGWVLLYLHVGAEGRVPLGTLVETGDLIGHPSCEGGAATGSHIHLARKYNGEWILADGPLPFELGGWVAHAGTAAYLGALVRDHETVLACTCVSPETEIRR